MKLLIVQRSDGGIMHTNDDIVEIIYLTIDNSSTIRDIGTSCRN